jgi:hypothetical protein
MLKDFSIIKQQLDSWVKIKFGPGVVGTLKACFIAVAMLIGIILFKIDNMWVLLGLGGVIIAFFMWFVLKVTQFAEKNPELALLEGAELSALKQAQLAAKNNLNPSPLDLPINNPVHSHTALLNEEVEKK